MTESTTTFDTQIKSLLDQIGKLNTANKGANNALYAVLAKCLGVYQSEFLSESDENNFERKVVELKERLKKLKIRYLEKSPVINLLVRFINGTDTKTSSAYAYVIEVASNKGLTENQASYWFREQGIDNIRKTFDREGNEKNRDGTSSNTSYKRDNKVYGAYARHKLNGYSCPLQFDEQVLNQQVPVVTTEYAAVLLRHPNGAMELKAMASDASTIEQVFASVAQSKGWDQLADKEHEASQLKALLDQDKLTLVDIRKIDGNLADECKKDWDSIHSMENDLADIPDEFELYRANLKKGDACHNRRADSGSKHYARALEELTELIEENPSLTMYLDRPFDPDINPDAELMPRFKNRISNHVDAAGSSPKSKKKDVFRLAIQNRIEKLSRKPESSRQSRRDEMLALVKKVQSATNGKISEMRN